MPAAPGRKARWLTPAVAVAGFTMISTLNFVDRGIIAGAGTTIMGCLPSGDHCNNETSGPCPGHNTTVPWNCTTHCRVCGAICDGKELKQTGFGIDTETLGYLQSSFLVGYSVACLVCAHLVHRIRPFLVLGIAGFLWSAAAVISGLPNVLCDKNDKNLCGYFWLMLAGRVLSGVGEAAIAVLAVPYIDDNVDPKKKGKYMSVYFMSLPVGTALGFVWAGAITNATGGQWQWAFWVEAPLMVPLSIAAVMVPNRLKRRKPGSRPEIERQSASPEEEPLLSLNDSGRSPSPVVRISSMGTGTTAPPPTLWHELLGCLSSPLFLAVSFGYASYSAVVAGLGFFGPLFIQRNRPCDPRWDFGQESADMYFGATVAATGFIGTALGGIWLDHRAKQQPKEQRENRIFGVVEPAWAILWQVSMGLGLTMGAAYMQSPIGFFAMLTLGCLFLFACTSGVNMVINWSVPTELRSMAIALSIMILHGAGDVPSPVAIGALADALTPHLTLVLTLSWLSWAIVLWGVAYLITSYRARREKASLQPSALLSDTYEDGDE